MTKAFGIFIFLVFCFAIYGIVTAGVGLVVYLLWNFIVIGLGHVAWAIPSWYIAWAGIILLGLLKGYSPFSISTTVKNRD